MPGRSFLSPCLGSWVTESFTMVNLLALTGLATSVPSTAAHGSTSWHSIFCHWIMNRLTVFGVVGLRVFLAHSFS